ncbi:hypothetical protein KXD40_007560 [Peronospora effusa]|nr:hypothetical protein KXD40_007560 [Peronospora effusa]
MDTANVKSTSGEVLLPLSRVDAMMRSHRLVILYIFPPSSLPYCLEKLQSSFINLVEQDYPILLGELYSDIKTGVVSVKQSIKSRQAGAAKDIRFETNSSCSMTTEQAIQERTWDLMPTIRSDTELICVKGTLLADGGLVVGLETSHMLFDAESIFTLTTVWGQHYSGVEKTHRLVVNHDRHLLGGTGSSSSMSHPEFRVVKAETKAQEEDVPAQAPPPASHYLFHLTSIKEAATWGGLTKNGVTENSYVSTIDAITALFTVLISQARGHGKEVRIATCVNARRRLDPPLPANYVGNAIFNALSTYSATELQSGDEEIAVISPLTLGKLARRVRESILKCDDTYLRDAVNFLSEQSNIADVQTGFNFAFGPDLLFTSWLHLGMYNAEFNGMHPWYASVPHLPCCDGFSIVTEAQKGGDGIDVGVFLECTAMEKLKKMFAEVSYLYE